MQPPRQPPHEAHRMPHLMHHLPPNRLTPAANPRFSWQYIWSFFMRAPRVRAWLFQSTRPPPSHVVQSLLSSPLLVGYIFGSYQENSRIYAFPDIGDLQTVFCRDGEALLGFHFGFQGVQPVMPLLFQVIKDPMLGNPNVIARRTARQRAPYPFHNYYLIIEFDWFQSGALAIVTSVSPIGPTENSRSARSPYLQNAEHRVFSRRTAHRLSAVAENLAHQPHQTSFPPPSRCAPLPSHFNTPTDDYFFLTVQEPDDPLYYANLQSSYIPPESRYQTFDVEKDILRSTSPHSNDDTVGNSTTTNTTSLSGSTGLSNGHRNNTDEVGNTDAIRTTPIKPGEANLHCDRGQVSSMAEPGTIALWKSYQANIAQSQRAGVIITMLGKKVGGRFSKPVSVFGRESKYVFLSTSGINVHGRIQRLCSQLGIDIGSPLPDQIVFSNNDGEVINDAVYTRHQRVVSRTHVSNAEEKVDKHGTGVGMVLSKRDRQAQPQAVSDITAQLRYEGFPSREGFQGSASVVAANGQVITGGSGVESKAVVAGGSHSPSCTSDGTGSVNAERMRNLKRRKFRECPSFSPSFQDVAPPPQHPKKDFIPHTTARGLAEQVGISHIPAQGEQDDDSQLRQKSFDLTHILSDSQSHEQQLGISSSGGSVGSNTIVVSAPKIEDEVEMRVGMESSAGAMDSVTVKANKTVWTCDRCGMHIRGKKGNLNRHIANKHDNIRAFACTRENCGRKFQTRLNLVRHETAVHDGRPHTCLKCPRSFKYEDDLKAHIKSAHDKADESLACQVCGHCFGRRSTLNRHMAKVHKDGQAVAAEYSSARAE